MAMLGDILGAARHSSLSIARWLEAGHPNLHASVSTAAAGEAMSISGFARVAVAEFDKQAAEEDWATLVSRMRGAADPGAACLLAILEWRLDAARTPALPLPKGS
jgi:hypothetical protein